MLLDFSAFLFFFTVATGLIWLLDACFWKKTRLAFVKGEDKASEPLLVEYSRSFFPVLLLVFMLRSFVVEPFRIPSGSMLPTLWVGDFILVNKFNYGIRLPISFTKITTGHPVQTGDVIVFRYPVNPHVNFIKRVVGLPGDKIDYKNKSLYINGKLVSKKLKDNTIVRDEFGRNISVRRWLEYLHGVQHEIYEYPDELGREVRGLIVPKGHYFVMGDNRDDSDDSRIWGFVSDQAIVGKAFRVWMSWDSSKFRVRFDRIGDKIV